jgi:Domain of unknown function (DUF1996)
MTTTRLRAAMGALAAAAGLLFTGAAAAQASTTSGWIDQCPYTHSNMDDPIVFPGVQAGTHLHDYSGNVSTNYTSVLASMQAAASTCPAGTKDTAAYWMPAVLVNGVHVLPCTSPNSASPRCTHYYRDDNVSAAYRAAHPPQPFPPGFKMIAGNSHARSVADNPYLGRELYYGCSDNSSPTGVSKPTAPVNCGTGIESIHIGFPNCWNGIDATTDTGRYNSIANTLRYPRSGVCPAGFPILLPRVIERWEIRVGQHAGATTLSSGATYTLHGDFWNTWKPGALKALVSRCLDAAVNCGNNPAP